MNWLKRHDVALYLVLAFALAWIAWPAALANPRPDSALMLPWSPLIAALVVLALTRGRKGVSELLRAMGRWRVGAKWYAVALLGPVALIVGAALINSALGGPPLRLPGISDLPQILVAFLVILVIQGPLTEEPGWRGYLLPRLMRDRSPLVASLIVALTWALWHLPLLVSDPSGQRPPLQFFVAVLGMSVAFAWLYRATGGSVLLPILMHAVNNTTASVVGPSQAGEYYGQFFWLYAGLWALFGIVVMRSRFMAVARVAQPVEAPAS